jgi:hypothetical protein
MYHFSTESIGDNFVPSHEISNQNHTIENTFDWYNYVTYVLVYSITFSLKGKKLEPKKHHRWEIVLDKYEEDITRVQGYRAAQMGAQSSDGINENLEVQRYSVYHQRATFNVANYHFSFLDHRIEYAKVEKFKAGDVVGISFNMTNSNEENDEKLKNIDDRFLVGGIQLGATVEIFKNRVSIGEYITCLTGQSFFPFVDIGKGVKVTIRPWI